MDRLAGRYNVGIVSNIDDKLLGRLDGGGDGVRRAALRHGDAVLGEELLALILE
jgi:hypothetical protein